MVIISDLLRCFLKIVALLSIQIVCCARMQGSHYGNSNCIIYRKEAITRTQKEKPFKAVKGFNTKLALFLRSYYAIINNLHVCSFTYPISHAHGRASKTVLRARNLVHKKVIICERVGYRKVPRKSYKYIDDLSKIFYREQSLSVTGLPWTTKLAFTIVSLN